MSENSSIKDTLGAIHRVAVGLMPYLIVVGIFIYFFQHTEDLKDRSEAYSIPREWNRTIEKLGVQPLYPPQEDFQVGDVFAVLISLDSHAHKWSNRSIVLGHVDLRDDILAQQVLRPRILQHAHETGDDWRLNAGDSDAIILSSIMFPGFSSNVDGSREADYSILAAGASGSSTSSSAQDIRITNAMTYGAGQPLALAKLMGFCEQSGMCGRAFLERLFMHQFGNDIVATGDEGVFLDISIRIVTRVFLSDELTIGSTEHLSASASANVGPARQGDDAGSAPGIEVGATSRARIEHDRKTHRPLVFGFHSIGLSAI